jgi:ABC-type bacteriocin/lantibiotic exporter with double-glycine peptidase domain
MLQAENPHSLFRLIQHLFGHISPVRKRQFGLLLVLTLFSSLAEVVSIGAVVPFIGILIEPERVYESSYSSSLISAFYIESPRSMTLVLCLLFAGAAVVAVCLRLLLLWVSIRLSNATAVDLGVDILRRTLYQPYRVSIARNSSEIISAMTLSIITLLVVMNPLIAFTSAASFGLAYWVVAWRTQRRLSDNSGHIAREQTHVVRSLQEGLGAIRDILIDGTQNVYVDLYHRAARQLQKAAAENTFINQAPRYLMESVGIALIALLALLFSNRPGGVSDALPALAMLAMGAQRLLPIMQQLYGNWTVLRGNGVALTELLELLEQPVASTDATDAASINFSRELAIKDLAFRYEGNGPAVIDLISVSIPAGARVGIIGSTGCGKSTLLDMIMGLLTPDQGCITIDGIRLTPVNMRAWQKKIAHVPQSIFLADASVAENIAFGVSPENIDMARVRAAAEQAQVAEFIETKLSGYKTRVGEKGAFLSGGQRQRIGIARALYKQANLLIFDEATSALDSETETSVMKAIDGLSQNLTIIIVAHRISTLRNCDFIIELASGRISKIYSYEELSH